MRCIAIDDEPIALEIIQSYCQRHGEIELLTFTDPIRGMEQVKRLRPDLLFLDIEMGEWSGVELARELPDGVHLVFTTAYSQFAVDGFDLGAIDFLHKPFAYSRFQRAVERSLERHDLKELELRNLDESITIKVEYRNVSLPLSSIAYIEAMGNYLRIFQCDSSTPLISQMTLKTIEEMLPTDQFLRVHRSFIVSRRAIKSHSRREIELRTHEQVIPIGRLYADVLG
ncbi:MAG: LytTR family DNA-binding domain-containing protein [Rikenellaceae bacterium]